MEILDSDRQGWLNRGKILANLGKHKQALVCYQRAIQIKPDYYQAWYTTSLILELLDCLESAESCFEQALGEYQGKKAETTKNRHRHILIPGQDIASCCYNWACFEALRGNKEQSIAYLKQAIELEGDKYRGISQQDSDLDLIRDSNRLIIAEN